MLQYWPSPSGPQSGLVQAHIVPLNIWTQKMAETTMKKNTRTATVKMEGTALNRPPATARIQGDRWIALSGRRTRTVRMMRKKPPSAPVISTKLAVTTIKPSSKFHPLRM